MALRLDRLPFGWNTLPGLLERYWDKTMTAIENSVNNFEAFSSQNNLLNSYVKSATPIISASSTGDVIITNHTRVYGNGDEVEVLGDTLTTGKPAGTIIRVFYSDATFSGGSVDYTYTFSEANKPFQQGATHLVGVVVIPSSGTVLGASLDPLGSIYL